MPAPQGREAIYSPGGSSSTAAKDPALAATWDASHRRITFYCPVGMVPELEVEMVRSGRSKTAVIVDALRAHLKASVHRR